MKTQKYTFGRRFSSWVIWDSEGRKVTEVFSYEAAVREVYRLNGWEEPKSINRKY